MAFFTETGDASMSFSQRVKSELVQIRGEETLAKKAEISALLLGNGRLELGAQGLGLTWYGDQSMVARRLYSLIRSMYDLTLQVLIGDRGTFKGHQRFQVQVPPQSRLKSMLMDLELLDDRGLPKHAFPHSLVEQEGGVRAFLRGLFLGKGSMNNPERGYYLEICVEQKAIAQGTCALLQSYELEATLRKRRQYWVVFLQRAEDIVHILNLMGAHGTLLDLESLRALKEVRNAVNRKVNWETANLDRTVQAAMEQLEDIEIIALYRGLPNLSPGLYEMACLRLRYPHASLKELAERMGSGISRSAVNHRLRRLKSLAKQIRKERGEH